MISNLETHAAGSGLASIEPLTKTFAAARADLVEAVQTLNDTLEAAKRQALPKLKRLVAVAAQEESALRNAIEAAPGLFVKPRTVVFHGITVGLRKGAGGIDWDDDEQVCALIEKHLPRVLHDVLIKTKKSPVKNALAELEVGELKKIGCRVEATGDVVVVKATDGAVNKLVAALLKDAAKLEETKD